MFPPRKILVPTDLSPNSAEAVKFAAEFAARVEAAVVLLHVIEPPSYPILAYDLESTPDARTPEGELRTWVQGRLDEQRTTIPKGIQVETEMRVGVPYREIVKAAADVDADMIILATHGHTGIKHALLGSSAERVVRTATCPVLTVRSRH